MNLWRFTLDLGRRYPKLFAVNIGLALVLMAVDGLTLFSIAPVVGSLTGDENGGGASTMFNEILALLGLEVSVVSYLVIFMTLSILSSATLVVINLYALKSKFAVREDMVIGTAELLLSTSINFVNRQRQGDFMNSLTQEAVRVSDAFMSLTRLISPIAQVAVLLAVPFYISWEITGIGLLSALLMTTPLRVFRKYGYRLGQAHSANNNRFFSDLQETLSNLRLIIGFANESLALRRLKTAFVTIREVGVKSQVLQSMVYAAYTPVGIIVVFICFMSSRTLGVPFAEVAVILYAFNRLAGTLATINSSMMQVINLYPSFEQIIRIRKEAMAERPAFGEKPFTGLDREIHLTGVSFNYAEGQPALSDLELSIPAGKMTALVGASGAGKSTLADIVMGLQQPSAGRITVDGEPMEDLDMGSYRWAVGYVPQQSALFNASIRENIKWANPNATEEDIRTACSLANAEEFIRGLDEGLETVVGDRGVRLSGGQVQRIALARALVREPALLVLDEATSALDSESEALIQSAIESIIGQTTILAIAHRLSTISQADNIIVLDRGRVVEQGTFNDLTERKGAFARLVEMQQL
tara:strand:- start:3292 stop:5046 length:1755 start_codon:yes stop_codon:yes gene_type:complete